MGLIVSTGIYVGKRKPKPGTLIPDELPDNYLMEEDSENYLIEEDSLRILTEETISL